MSGDEPSTTPSKKPTFTPKAIIHQKFGSEACYTIEEVKESSANECPGLAIPQKTPCLFRCRLELPDFCVVSKACRRKKEAEQLAAELALRKLGIDSNTSDAPVLDSAEELISRLKFLFSDEQVRVNIFSRAYYLDSTAHELGAPDASKVFISRTIGKASSEMRLYFLASEICSLDSLSDTQGPKDSVYDKKINTRATFLFGQKVYGTAILATIWYKWKSADLYYEDVTLCTYFRMLVGKMPSGLCKLSRESLLAAELPVVFTTRTHWRGLLPRELLCTLCRQYRLSEPTFSVIFDSLEPARETTESCKKLKVKDSNVEVAGNETCVVANGKDAVVSEGKFRCEVSLFSKSQQLLLQCIPKESYKKQSDAVQNASLRVLSWLNVYFMQPDILSEKLTSFGAASGIHCDKSQFLKEFYLYQSIHDLWTKNDPQGGSFLSHINQQSNILGHDNENLIIEGPETGAAPSNGSLVCIKYNVFLVSEVEKQHLESSDEFEFEIGTGSVIPYIEAAVLQMVVGQSISGVRVATS